ncbi:MAG: hypothetical protein KIT43_15380 [Bauldia sp.]|nr:hypothetical protein [Bauldia sp.]
MTKSSHQPAVNRFVAIGLFRFVIWYAAVYPVVVAGITIGLRFVNEGGDENLWRNLTIAPVYYLVACGVVAVATLLPMIVAHGGTRRAFSRAAAPMFAGLSVITGLYVLALIGFDALVSSIFGWEPTVSGVVELASVGDRVELFLDTMLAGLCALATGWLAGIVWQSAVFRRRLGWIPATLLMVPCAIPIVAAEIVLHRPPFGADFADALDLDLGVAGGAIAALAIGAASLALAAYLTRDVIVGGRASPA